jgi:hypothetical protein
MKRIVLAGLVAVGMMAIGQQHASAWVNSKFGVGLNWDVQSGGNNLLWGLWRNGQPPGPEAFGGGAPFVAPMPQPYAQSYAPQYAPMPLAYAPQTAEPPVAMQYMSPYQFATYQRPEPVYYYYYYYPTPYYGR